MHDKSLKVNYKTDTGKRRTHNEDSIIVDGKQGIFLLADGMGGHQAGEVASRMAVEVAYDHLTAFLGPDSTDMETFKIMTSALSKADQSIKLTSTKDNLSLMGMGTTLVLTLIRGDRAYICHAGDSRVYLLRQDIIRQLTKDQTWGYYLVEQKNMTPDKIPPQSWHILTQAVGVTNKITPEMKKVRLKPGDILLLCSDGLTDMLSDAEVREIIRKHEDCDFNKTALALVEAANNKGGKDNISVVLVKYKDSDVEFECTTYQRFQKRKERNLKNVKREGVKREGMKREGMKHEGMKREGVKREGMKRDNVKRENVKFNLTHHASRITPHASRITHHASRIMHHTNHASRLRSKNAYS